MLAILILLGACVADPVDTVTHDLGTNEYNDLNNAAGTMVLYEVQVRTANACQPNIGADWQRAACTAKVAPAVTYRAQDSQCGDLGWLHSIKLGTLDDLLADTADYRAGITVRYIHERVGATAMWLMPLFPNNDRWSLPDACDNLGSPYAVRDYMHARGSLDNACISAGRDEYSSAPCWGNGALERVIAAAHSRGMKVVMDVALNHFGHNYLMYDYADFDPVRERVGRGEQLGNLWDYAATRDDSLLHPVLLDTVDALWAAAGRSEFHQVSLTGLRAHCPDLAGDALVRAYNMWRVAFNWEREQFSCAPGYLENGVPAFYLGRNAWDPSTGVGDNFTNEWRDVKFLFHQEGNWHGYEFARQREYLFRIINYWVSRGVDGFRLDHTTDGSSGLGPNEWDYIISKVDYYAWLRGQPRPMFLAEEFHDQGGMSHVADIMTEGYLSDMVGRGGVTKDTGHIESVVANRDRFDGHTYVMTALETHDERRLVDDAGFDMWTGAGFWGIGATTWSTPMLLMGQEFGASRRLDFRKSDLLRSRFVGTGEYRNDGDALVGFYHAMASSRLNQGNRALTGSNYAFLRSRWTNAADARIFAQVKWADDGNVVFTFHNLWRQNVQQSFYVPTDIAAAIGLDSWRSYRLRDVMSNQVMGTCHSGADLAWDLYVQMSADTRLQWLRLEQCP